MLIQTINELIFSQNPLLKIDLSLFWEIYVWVNVQNNIHQKKFFLLWYIWFLKSIWSNLFLHNEKLSSVDHYRKIENLLWYCSINWYFWLFFLCQSQNEWSKWFLSKQFFLASGQMLLIPFLLWYKYFLALILIRFFFHQLWN